MAQLRRPANKMKNGSGKYLKAFIDSGYYKQSQTKWYKYWSEHIGAVLGNVSCAVEDEAKAIELLDQVTKDNPDTHRRIKYAKQGLNAKQEAEKAKGLAMEQSKSTIEKNEAMKSFFNRCGNKEMIKAKGKVHGAMLNAVEFLKGSQFASGINIVEYEYWTEKSEHQNSIRECSRLLKSDDDKDKARILEIWHILVDVDKDQTGRKLLDILRSSVNVEDLLSF